MKFEAFSEKLGSWADLFKPFIESESMDDIYSFLKREKERGRIVTPDSTDTFRVFKELDRNNLKVVWYLQDPYPSVKNGIKTASGIAMDCSNTRILQPSLSLFWRAIHKEVYGDIEYKFLRNPSLLPLVKEGIMFLNTDLTCMVGDSSSHKGRWLEFQKYFIKEILNQYYSGLIFVLSGKTSQGLRGFIGDQHYIFENEHPAYAYRQEREWNTDGVFKSINNLLWENNKIRIPWIPELEELVNSCPF